LAGVLAAVMTGVGCDDGVGAAETGVGGCGVGNGIGANVGVDSGVAVVVDVMIGQLLPMPNVQSTQLQGETPALD
jgi:hypothetical protein